MHRRPAVSLRRSSVVVLLSLALVSATATQAFASDQHKKKTTHPPRATLYAFWATWCVPCRVELPHMERLHRKYRNRGLRVVLVSEDAPSTAQNIPAFLARFGVTAPWVLDNESELLEEYNPSANVPFIALLDSAGNVVYAHAGYEPGDEKLVERAIQSVLARRATTKGTKHARDKGRVTATMQGLGVWRTSRFDPVPDRDGLLRAAVGRFEVTGRSGNNAAMARVDGAAVSEEVLANDTDARLERIRLGTRHGALRLQLGDDYVAFGHGLSLSLRKIDPLGLDTSLRGVRVDATLRGADLTLVAGQTNPQNLDPLELRVVDDVSDFIGGAELRVPLGSRGVVAPYAVAIDARGAAADGGDVTWLANGVSTSLQFGDVRIAAEAAAGIRDGMALELEFPRAAYASVQWTRGRLTTLLDAKSYRHWEIGRVGRSLLYHEPPTLEREDQEVPSNDSALGSRLRLEYRLPIRATVFANALGYRFSEDETAPRRGSTALHGYVGAEKRFGSGASSSLQAGYRDESKSDGSNKLHLWHVDFDAAIPLRDKLGLTLKWNHRSETKVVFNDLDFVRGLAVAGLSWSGLGAASILYGYSTERSDGVAPTHYPAAELLLHLPRGGSARMFVGQLTGGRVCVSGSCRDVPPFRGARLDFVWRQ